MNILVVDDSATNRKLLRVTLEAESDCRICEAEDGEAALAILEREPVDAIISDILMPNLDGFGLCKRVRESEGLRELPIMLYTSTYNSPGDEKLALMMGADRYMRKPAPARVLMKTVQELVTCKTRRPVSAEHTDDAGVMRRYNAALIHKLEDKNAELETAHAELRESNRLLIRHANELERLNLSLEQRVKERTEELERSNAELARSNREIQGFYHTLSHELKTPLTSAREFVSILRDGLAGPMNETQKEYLGYVWEGFDQLRVCINDLLDATRLETGKFAIDLRPVPVEKLVASLTERLAPAASAKNIRLTWEVQPNLGAVPMDGVRITQVLTNLVNNALKFTAEEGRIAVTVDIDSANPEFVRFAVSDNGRGMEADQLGRIFDRLYQIQRGDAATEGGLGMGLYLCRELVRLHHGEIWVESTPGRGSTFTFVISKAQSTQPFRVLVVDDDPAVLKSVQRVLEGDGLKVTTAGGGTEALNVMKQHVPAVVLLDLEMPDLDGAATLHEIRRHWGALPVIVHTGYPNSALLNRALESSPFTLLAKPSRPDELIATVRSVIKQDEISLRRPDGHPEARLAMRSLPASKRNGLSEESEAEPRYANNLTG